MDWKSILRKNFTCVESLCDFLALDAEKRTHVLASPRFILNLPERLAAKIAKNTLEDPLLKQFLPMKSEQIITPGFFLDPVEDGCARKERKLLVKYPGRALLLCTSACAMHCRFCFRQKFDYETKQHSLEKELAMIAADPSLREIILSGGDPLSLNNATLHELFDNLAAIPHLSLLRIHTRFPIGIPERIDKEFLELLRSCRLQIWMVIHCNHPRELDNDILHALKCIRKEGAIVLNAAVLLRGINDMFEVQKELHQLLAEHGIVPYYLHQLDRVQGSAHFEVSMEEGVALIHQLRAALPGYAVPRYVAEIPGKLSKTTLA